MHCADTKRSGEHETCRFDFLGFAFKQRVATRRGKVCCFTPAVSDQAATTMRRTMRRWHLGERGSQSLAQNRAEIAPIVQGWVQCYGEQAAQI